MFVNVTFKELNPDFNKEYAQEYQFGKESESNWKTTWSVSCETENNIDETRIIQNSKLSIKAKKDGIETLLEFDGVTILECFEKGKRVNEFAVSASILDRVLKNKNSNSRKTYFTFYLKPGAKSIKPLNGIFIDMDVFPKEYL